MQSDDDARPDEPKPSQRPSVSLVDLNLADLVVAVLDRLPNPILVKNEELRFELVNDALCRLLGVQREQMIGAKDSDFVPIEQAEHFNARDRLVLATGEVDECQEALTSADGSEHVIITRKTRLATPDGKAHLVGVITDISEHIRYETELEAKRSELARLLEEVIKARACAEAALADAQRQHRLLHSAAGVIGDAFALFDHAARLVFANEPYCRLHDGARLDELISHHFDELAARLGGVIRDGAERVPAPWDTIYRQPVDEPLEIELPHGRWLLARSGRTADGFVVITLTDVSELKRKERALSDLAYHDPLTGLGNRAQFKRLLERLVPRHGKCESSLALMLLDLDRFKMVNDTLGHEAGDLLLIKTADRLREVLCSRDGLCRLGGDEFAVVIQTLHSTVDAMKMAERILSALSAPFDLEGQPVTIVASIGIALVPDDATDLANLVRHADLALYQAKDRAGNNYRFFEAGMNAQVQRRQYLEQALRDALDRDSLVLFFQPQIELRTRRIAGAEVLLRWHHRGAWISPSEFVPIAERSGLIHRLGLWVLRTACRQTRAWRDLQLEPPPLAVNVSAEQFTRKGFVEAVIQLIAEFALPKGAIQLELTQSIFLSVDSAVVKSAIERLQAAGLTLSLDDFGTGYSSLAYLRELPISELKLDACFVRELGTTRDARKLVAGMITLGHSLGMRVVGEGVETDAQAQDLRRLGCDLAQGFLFGGPMSSAHLLALLAANLADAHASGAAKGVA